MPRPRLALTIFLLFIVSILSLTAGPMDANPATKLKGSPAPGFSLPDAKGAPIKLSDFKGKVVLLNFWATWCHGCQTEIPWFGEFQTKYGADGLTVIGVSMDEDGWTSVRPYLQEKKLNYPIVIGSKALGDKYGLDNMPLTSLIDRDGKIAEIYSGVVDRAATEKAIEMLLAQKAGAADKNLK